MKYAFITGITGQDGSYLTELLLEKGYIEIYFEYVNGVPLQSDSIWVLNKYIK